MQNVSKKRVYRMSHSASLRRSIFMYHQENQMVQLYHGYILHSKSFPTTPHMPKSEFKRRSYVINKLEKKISPLADFVATEPVTRLSCDKTQFFCNSVRNKLCCDKPRFCRDRVLATNSIVTKPNFVTIELKTKP